VQYSSTTVSINGSDGCKTHNPWAIVTLLSGLTTVKFLPAPTNALARTSTLQALAQNVLGKGAAGLARDFEPELGGWSQEPPF